MDGLRTSLVSFVHLILALESLSQHDPCGGIIGILLNCIARVLFGLGHFQFLEGTASLFVLASGFPGNSQTYSTHRGAAHVGKVPGKTGFIFGHRWLWERLHRRRDHPSWFHVGTSPGHY